MARKTGGSACAFCGDGRAVKHRVIPAWLDACFPAEQPFDAQRAIACKTCLAGWLAQIDETAAPVLEWVVAGRPFLLAQQNQETVAAWGAKTILMLQCVRDPRLLPHSAYQELRERRRPPSGFRIHLAARPRQEGWPYRFASTATASSGAEHGLEPTLPGATIDDFCAELGVGHLVLRASARFTPHGRAFQHGEATEVWPLGAPLQWPPKRAAAQERAQIRAVA